MKIGNGVARTIVGRQTSRRDRLAEGTIVVQRSQRALGCVNSDAAAPSVRLLVKTVEDACDSHPSSSRWFLDS
jgi:hypothetical protein